MSTRNKIAVTAYGGQESNAAQTEQHTVKTVPAADVKSKRPPEKIIWTTFSNESNK